jgi:hypothetical protein
MGAIHQVRGLTYGEDVGWAVGGGLKLNLPWAKGDVIHMQAAYAKGALDYVLAGVPGAFIVSNDGTSIGYGTTYDAVGTGTDLELTEGWSVGAAFQHSWNSMWKTSLYGGYGQVDYGAAATAVVNGGGTGDPDWSFAQIGSRTMWTPVQNLQLSVDVIYNHVGSGSAQGGATVVGSDVGWVAGIFRAQRNFWP